MQPLRTVGHRSVERASVPRIDTWNRTRTISKYWPTQMSHRLGRYGEGGLDRSEDLLEGPDRPAERVRDLIPLHNGLPDGLGERGHVGEVRAAQPLAAGNAEPLLDRIHPRAA